jgi:hypothetical protein
MDNLILNIGLDGVPSSTTGRVAIAEDSKLAAKVFACSRALRTRGFVILNNRVVRSDSELTWVVEVTRNPSRPNGDYLGVHGAVRSVAHELNQEVIAAWDTDRGAGKMLGRTFDLDDSWGDFDPALFFMYDGRRLVDVLNAV